MLNWVQTNWLAIGSILGALHVILNVLGKLFNNKAIQGLDNLLLGILGAFGIKPSNTEPPKA